MTKDSTSARRELMTTDPTTILPRKRSIHLLISYIDLALPSPFLLLYHDPPCAGEGRLSDPSDTRLSYSTLKSTVRWMMFPVKPLMLPLRSTVDLLVAPAGTKGFALLLKRPCAFPHPCPGT